MAPRPVCFGVAVPLDDHVLVAPEPGDEDPDGADREHEAFDALLPAPATVLPVAAAASGPIDVLLEQAMIRADVLAGTHAATPALRDAVRTVFGAVLERDPAWCSCRAEARAVLLSHAVASGAFGPAAVTLAAVVAALEAGVQVLDRIRSGRSGFGHAAAELVPVAFSLLAHVPAGLLDGWPGGFSCRDIGDPAAGGGDAPDPFAWFGNGHAAETIMVGETPVLRLGLRSRRRLYAVLAARLAGTPPDRTEINAAFARALGIAWTMRRDLADLLDPGKGFGFADGVIGAPVALHLAQALPGARHAMLRLHATAANSDLEREIVRRRVVEGGAARQAALLAARSCRRAAELAFGLRAAPDVAVAVADEIRSNGSRFPFRTPEARIIPPGVLVPVPHRAAV